MKIAVIMTYFNRQYQLDKTLNTLLLSKHNDFEVIIVDDCSEKPPQIKIKNFPITVIRTKNKTWTNPEPAYNIGIDLALRNSPDIIILQNAECYHVGDVLKYADKITDYSYTAFGCFSINEEATFRFHDIHKMIYENRLGASRDGQNAWYNHPIYRPVGYEFCGAISASNMIKLNGYDERLSLGCGYGDDYLLHRIKLLGLKVEITETPFVVHQWHYNIPVPPNKGELVRLNKSLFEKLRRTATIKAERLFPFEYELIN